MIFSPKIGLRENVIVLEYANLILKHNLSYERVTSTKDGRIMRGLQIFVHQNSFQGHYDYFSRQQPRMLDAQSFEPEIIALTERGLPGYPTRPIFIAAILFIFYFYQMKACSLATENFHICFQVIARNCSKTSNRIPRNNFQILFYDSATIFFTIIHPQKGYRWIRRQ